MSADKWDTRKICQDGEMLKLLGKSSGKNRSQKFNASRRESSQKSADLCNVQGFLKFLSDFCFEFTPRSHQESRGEDSSLQFPRNLLFGKISCVLENCRAWEREAKRVTMSRFQISCILAEMAAGLCGDENMGEPMSNWGQW